jgi:phage baseplate assembly protein W
MQTLLVPFRFSATGRIATTSDMKRIAEQQILDVLVTGLMERVMRPEYGANVRRLLFDPMNDLALADAASNARDKCVAFVKVANVLEVRMVPRVVHDGVTVQAVLDVYADYTLPPVEEVITVHYPLVNYLNEETPFQ